MAIPEGYEKLAVVGIAWKGDYVAGTAYKVMNAVYYNGSTYVALRDNPTGAPMADSTNWQYLAKGFVAALLSMVTAKDTSGIMGTAGADVGAQDLMDAIANKMVTELMSNTALTEKLAGYLLKSQVVNNQLATVPGNVLDAMQGKALGDAIAKQNRDLDGKADKVDLNKLTIGKINNTVVYLGLNVDFDTIGWHYVLAKGPHSPDDGFWYVETLSYHSNNDGTVKTGIQIARQYLGTRMAQRQRFENGAWTAWT